MYSDDDIDSAVTAGAISGESAAALRRHVAMHRATPSVDEEHFRLISGFNDIFVVLACGLLFVALGWLGAAVEPPVGAFLVAGASWVLSEFFVRRRRMALPAIVLLVTFAGSIFIMIMLAFPKGTSTVAMASVAAATAAWAHWLRFRVPITIAVGVMAATGAVITALYLLVPAAKEWQSTIVFVAGLAIFAYALRWDASDVKRQTNRSDVAFWLHLLAAPLLVHPVFTTLGTYVGELGALRASVILALYVAIALVSLWIDRRALMVSALGYVLFAFSTLLKQSGIVSFGFAVTALVVGLALLLLSGFWQNARAAVFDWLPTSLQRRVPPLQ